MRVLLGDTWSEEYLDPTPHEDRVAVHVRRQIALAPVRDKYFVRRPDPVMLLAYLRAIGPKRVARKVLSRRAEARRNDAWVSVGVGTVGDDPVLFLLTAAPRGITRGVVPQVMTWPWPEERLLPGPGHLVPTGDQVPRSVDAAVAREVEALAGWSPEAGPATVSPSTVEALVDLLADASPGGFRVAPAAPSEGPWRERLERRDTDVRTSFTCFGYGQYAKTQAIANLGRHIDLACVHEIDPVQLGPIDREQGPAWDTSPVPRPDEPIVNAVLAGFHHTHAPIAVDLLDRGARHIVIEKPLATSHEQLDDLLAAMDRHPDARIHAAFQRRHAPFNERLRRDLGPGAASMSATVYEVPLPAHHWYRWPVVGNSVVSNGCHWIDYFLHVNDFADVTRHEAMVFRDHVVLGLELTNGASCSISLRHEGSPRLGVRDLITFWNGDVTVTIEDNSRYRAERGYRSPRPRRCPRVQSHEDMYVEFGRRIASDDRGDSRRSIEVSTRAMLVLAALVDDARG